MFELQESGVLGFIVSGVKEAWHFFWISCVLLGFLDNAPTYLLFFNVAGGDADVLMTEKAHILQAITCGAVFFRALSYIGKASNMLRNIPVESGVKMLSFVGYLVWACGFMFPMFALVTVIFFRP
ncbi:hypothetical protein BJ742DRAFT_889374 [Cladochytrium replicatum]|nr:hypothetical protein BJ742DRAFT_889374 [Cladochytrium replicatum]